MTGKHFPRRRSFGKKIRRAIAGVGVWTVAVTLIGGLGIAQEAEPSHKATLTFSDEAIVKGDDIRLSEIATVTSDDEALKRELETLVVGRSPRVGFARPIRSDGVRLALRRERERLGIEPEDVAFDGPKATQVRLESQKVESSAILERLEPWLFDQVRRRYRAERIEFDIAGTAPTFILPKGEWTMEPLLTSLPPRPTNSVSIPVRLSVDGEPFKTTGLALNLRLFASVPVAARTIHRHETLAETDVEYVETDLLTLNGRVPMRSFDEVLSVRSTQEIRPGEPLTEDNSESIPLISKGDPVTMILEAPHLRLTTVGEAQQDGRLGDMIRVKNLRSQQVVRVEVVAERVVKVDFVPARVAPMRSAIVR